MQIISCSGTPYQIGLQHGQKAKDEIARSIVFYKSKFRKACKLEWEQVQDVALTYVSNISEKWPDYLEEMRGVAEGSNRALSEIIALNVRTELAFGQFSDGCTSLSWLTDNSSYLAQNWDWEVEQQENLILLTIDQQPKPTIKMMTEAGIIGKIGLNSAGVGVCLNAIRALGVDANRIPCHLGLRLVLDSTSRQDAVAHLSRTGVASACHMLIADATGGTGVEWSAGDGQSIPVNKQGQILHTNHYLLTHPGVTDTFLLSKDTRVRLDRLGEILEPLGHRPKFEEVQRLFMDSQNYPAAICRGTEDPFGATLFNIVMDLRAKKAEVVVGRPSEPESRHILDFTTFGLK